jgi:hypothetical protein
LSEWPSTSSLVLPVYSQSSPVQSSPLLSSALKPLIIWCGLPRYVAFGILPCCSLVIALWSISRACFPTAAPSSLTLPSDSCRSSSCCCCFLTHYSTASSFASAALGVGLWDSGGGQGDGPTIEWLVIVVPRPSVLCFPFLSLSVFRSFCIYCLLRTPYS